MAHIRRQAHTKQYPIHLGSRGRLVLPAALRKELGVQPGDRLVVIVDQSGEARIVSARNQVEKYCGMLGPKMHGRMLSDELIAERRDEARREDEA